MKPYLLLLNCFYDKGRVGKSQEQFIKKYILAFLLKCAHVECRAEKSRPI